jgi:hypothetical protein
MRKITFNNGKASEPINWLKVMKRQPFTDRMLLGDVMSWYYDDAQNLRLKVRHFNGDPWPIEPIAPVS